MIELKINFRIITPAERELFYYCQAKNKFKTLYFADLKKKHRSADSFLNSFIYLALTNKFIDYTFSSCLIEYSENLMYGCFADTELKKSIQF